MEKPKTVKLYDENGELHECTVREINGDWACTSPSGRIFFFPQTEITAKGKEVQFTWMGEIRKHNNRHKS